MMQELPANLSLLPRAELITQLSASLGEAKAAALVDAAAETLGIVDASFSQHQALAILEVVSSNPGLVGIVARCAKARVILRYNKK